MESRHRTSSLNTADSEHASGAFDPETRRKSVYQCEYEYVIFLYLSYVSLFLSVNVTGRKKNIISKKILILRSKTF